MSALPDNTRESTQPSATGSTPGTELTLPAKQPPTGRSQVERPTVSVRGTGGEPSTADNPPETRPPAGFLPTAARGVALGAFGEYEILGEIARGGMGVVYRARQKRLNRTVALKMILAGGLASSTDVQRFYTEAEAAAQLEHSGIVPIYEIGEQAGQPFFSMAFIDGQSLQARLKEGPLPAREAAELVVAVAEAVAYAHSKGIVHRDLKPHNILLDSEGKPKITDFGLAKRLDSEHGLTVTGDVMGTPSYMAPEQAAGKVHELGPLVDVYALGAILYAALTGRPPFQAASLAEVLRQVIEQEPVSPNLLNTAAPRDLDTVCLKCLHKDPRRRYASASEVAADLSRFLRGEPIAARPVSTTERTWRWCRRNPVVAALLATVACLLVAAAVASSLVAIRMGNLAFSESQAKSQAQNKAADEQRAREAAQQATEREKEAKAAVVAKSEETRRFLSQQYVRQGARAIDDSDYSLALLWFVKALETDAGDPEREPDHRLRIANTLRAMPKMFAVFPHDGPIEYAEPSPDGRRIVTAAYDNTARVWDLEAPDEPGKILRHQGYVYHACFSPDGNLVATASADGTARVWNAQSGEPVTEPLPHGWSVRYAVFSPDSKRLATACGSPNQQRISPRGVVRRDAPRNPSLPLAAVWSIAEQSHVDISRSRDGDPLFIAFDPTGTLVATNRKQDELIVCDAATGELRAGPWHHGGFLRKIEFALGGKFVLTIRPFETRVWNVAENRQHGQTIAKFNLSTEMLSPTQLRIGETVWDLQTGASIRSLTSATVVDLLHQDDRTSVLVSGQLGLRVAEAESRIKQGATGASDDSAVDNTSLRFESPWLPVAQGRLARLVPGGRQVMAISENQSNVKVWDVASQMPLTSPLQQPGIANDATYSPDGSLIAVGCDGGPAKIFSTQSGQIISPALYHGTNKSGIQVETRVAFDPSGNLLATAGGGNRQVHVYRIADFSEIVPPLVHPGNTVGLEFAQGGRALLVACNSAAGTSYYLWNLTTGAQAVPALHVGHMGNRWALDPTGTRLVAGNGSSDYKLWDLATGQAQSLERKHDFFSGKPAFSHNGQWIATAGADSQVWFWDAKTGQAKTQILLDDTVLRTAFTANDRFLVVGTNTAL